MLVLVFLPLQNVHNKKSWWDGIQVELKELEFELSGQNSVNFWSRERRFSSSSQGIQVWNNWVKMIEKRGEIQGKLDLAWFSEELAILGS